ncbi:hypothetical protein MMC19_005330 [Ptychographa xylographoides]|nr:hypothetical protein [Ptychographa xylographoides]
MRFSSLAFTASLIFTVTQAHLGHHVNDIHARDPYDSEIHDVDSRDASDHYNYGLNARKAYHTESYNMHARDAYDVSQRDLFDDGLQIRSDDDEIHPAPQGARVRFLCLYGCGYTFDFNIKDYNNGAHMSCPTKPRHRHEFDKVNLKLVKY